MPPTTYNWTSYLDGKKAGEVTASREQDALREAAAGLDGELQLKRRGNDRFEMHQVFPADPEKKQKEVRKILTVKKGKAIKPKKG